MSVSGTPHTIGTPSTMQVETSNHIFGQACVHCNLKKVLFVLETQPYGHVLTRKD